MRLLRVLLLGALLACAPAAMAQEDPTATDEAAPAMEQPVDNNSGDQPAESAPESASPAIQPQRFPNPSQPEPCIRVTEGFDQPTRPPCRPAQLQPVLPGFVTASLISLPQGKPDSAGQPTYDKPAYPNGVPLYCVGEPFCPQSVVNQIPSPVGETLFGSISMATNESKMDLDNSGAIYAYNCLTGTCQGFAYQVWEAMPGAQKEAYLSAVMDGIIEWHPDATPTITVSEYLPAHVAKGANLVPVTLAKVESGQKLFSAGLFFPAGMTVGPRTPHWAAHLP